MKILIFTEGTALKPASAASSQTQTFQTYISNGENSMTSPVFGHISLESYAQ